MWEQIRKPVDIGIEITEGSQVMEEAFMSFDEREGYNPADEEDIS